MKTKIFIFLFILFFHPGGYLARAQDLSRTTQSAKQTGTYNRTIIWEKPIKIKISEYQELNLLSFQGAQYNEDNIPYYYEKFKIPHQTDIEINILNQQFSEFTFEEEKIIQTKNYLQDKILPKVTIGYEKKMPYAVLSFIPIRKNKSSGKYERLISFDIEIISKSDVKKKIISRTYADNSVLASGNWYKIGVNYDAVYKLSYDFLLSLGINVNSIDPRNIRIYGHGGGMLPEANSSPTVDDLLENAILVEGEQDGIFNNQDYILFYGTSPHKWIYDTTDNKFHHIFNPYSDVSYYFITTDLGAGKRIQNQPSSTQNPTQAVTSFDDYAFWEQDLVNLITSGRQWYGETFELILTHSKTFSFPNIASTSAYIKAEAIARAINTQTSFSVDINNVSVLTFTVSGVSQVAYSIYANTGSAFALFTPNSSDLNISVTYQPTSDAIGWLNYIELNVRRNLIMSGSQLLFRDAQSVGQNNISEFILANANPNIIVWDVTSPLDIKQQNTELQGNNLIFQLQTNTLHQFVAFDKTAPLPTPTALGQIPNQNLHALNQIDLVIIAHPDFLTQANTLADFHINQDNLSVIVVTPQQIYNEFSSGSQDVVAIRNFMKMLYNKSTHPSTLPKYLLLFGDASYDYKNRLSNNTNFVPAYQSPNSLDPVQSFVTDDFYGYLDDTEGLWGNGDLLDIGIGRLPVKSDTEAQEVVDKILRYKRDTKIQMPSSLCESGSAELFVSNFADWRNWVCFLADDEDGNDHISKADGIANMIDADYPEYNIDKIYLDAYVQTSTAGGQRYPEAVDALNRRVQKGALMINYTGHSGEVGWAHERILEIDQIQNWTNRYNLPLFVAAGCEFGRYDDPDRTSAGELILLNPNGAGIATLATSRLAYSSHNYNLNKNFSLNLFKTDNNEYPRLGDVYQVAKASVGSNLFFRTWVHLGNPAMKLAYPEHKIITTAINQNPIDSILDTIKAFNKVTVSGYIQDKYGTKLTDFNGYLYPTVFDKTTTLTTLSNDPQSPPFNFTLQKNVIYKGKASITNGEFSFSFVVPKDIGYNYGKGRISYYGENGTSDGNGYFEDFIIGGSDTTSQADVIPPTIELYLNDKSFVSGGLTNENPILFVHMFDSNGINTVGNGIGHDLVAILDNNTARPIILNDYYESDLDSYQSGTIKYPFYNLPEGEHNLKVKVWDVYNNSNDASIDFIVAELEDLQIDHVLNYPNPFTTRTEFYFEHNQPCCFLDVQLQIFTITGKVVKTINTVVRTDGFRIEPIVWDGKDDFGDRLARGVYIYLLTVRGSNGTSVKKYEKLFIL